MYAPIRAIQFTYMYYCSTSRQRIKQDDHKLNSLFWKSSLVCFSDHYINLMDLVRYLDVKKNSVRSTLISLALFTKNLKIIFYREWKLVLVLSQLKVLRDSYVYVKFVETSRQPIYSKYFKTAKNLYIR